MHRVDNPVDSRITANSFVLRINEDDFKVFVCRILIDPVGVEDSQVCAATANTLFSGGSKGSLVFELVHTLVCGFA